MVRKRPNRIGQFSLDESPKGIVVRDPAGRRTAFVRGKGKRSRQKANTIREILNRV